MLSYTDTFLTIYLRQEYITLLYIQKRLSRKINMITDGLKVKIVY
ncbi:hypothetical protein BOVA713_2615 [Bacteroides ovatus]|uniref:Uncharacterized protein n=1 Tax=Bacteroides ovatus (strain ATCC 8483 / DSM 1896 / JCM 5824 / BCRC 10623 / CCUG 4943 / NCTC 11153) TaxID=411476 RepID=A0AAN3A7R7_BACO1|nr:hypothetical protein BACOVA_02625 [Bacteroides ovatus ATCC 8483]CAG9897099.1 hypothetical protein BOVA713_2615 [Bacteroides ovatus]